MSYGEAGWIEGGFGGRGLGQSAYFNITADYSHAVNRRAVHVVVFLTAGYLQPCRA